MRGRLRSFWRNLWHRSAMEQDMADELAFHLERRAEDLMRRGGVSPDEARRLARLEFGSVEKHKDEARRSLGLRPLDELRADLCYAWRSYTHSKFFGGLAMLLATIGLYGVLSYLVAQRQMEFGVRMAHGARPASILWLVMREVLLVLAAGVAVGLAAALATARVLRQLLFGLEPHDPATIAIAIALLTAMAVLAGYLPARRATRVDPIIALRSD